MMIVIKNVKFCLQQTNTVLVRAVYRTSAISNMGYIHVGEREALTTFYLGNFNVGGVG